MKLKYSTIIAITAAALVSACSTDSDATKKVDELTLQAEAYEKQGQYRAASIEAQNILQLDGNNQASRRLLARTGINLGNYHQAINALEPIVSTAEASSLLLLVEAYIDERKFVSARALLDKINSTTLTPEETAVLKLVSAELLIHEKQEGNAKKTLASLDKAQLPNRLRERADIVEILLLAQEAPDAASTSLENLLTNSPNHVEALLLKGSQLFRQEQFEEAEEVLTKALINLPQTDIVTLQRIRVLSLLAQTLSHLGRSSEAMQYNQLIAAARPGAQDAQAKIKDAEEKYRAGDVAGAEEALLAIYQDSNNDYVGTLLGAINLEQGDLEEANRFLSQHVDPENAPARALSMLAEAQLRMNQPDQARKSIEENIANNPNSAMSQGVYGLTLLSQGKEAEAVKAIEKAIALDPGRVRLRAALAQYYNSKKQPQKALAQLELAINVAPKDGALQEMLINQYLVTGETGQALQIAKRFKTDTGGVDSAALYGTTLLRAGKTSEAQAEFDSILVTAPTNRAALQGLLAIAFAQKDLNKAQQRAEKLVAAEPNNAMGYQALLTLADGRGGVDILVNELNSQAEANDAIWAIDATLASFYLKQGQIENAIRHATRAVDRGKGNTSLAQLAASAHIAQAREHQASKKYDLARAALVTAQSLSPNHPETTAALINLEMAAGQVREAEKILSGITAENLPDPLKLELHGDISLAKDDASQAERYYQQAWRSRIDDSLGQKILNLKMARKSSDIEAFVSDWLEKSPKSSLALTRQGDLAMAKGNSKGAMAAYEKAIGLNSNNALALNNLAWLQMENGDRANAKANAARAATLQPDDAAIQDTYGWILFNSGEKAQGRAVLEKAASLAPENQEIQAHLKSTRN